MHELPLLVMHELPLLVMHELPLLVMHESHVSCMVMDANHRWREWSTGSANLSTVTVLSTACRSVR
jgi:hypothetical protein